LGQNEALGFRAAIIDGVVLGYKPDALFLDFLPLGKYDEMAATVEHSTARKYFIVRGVLDHPDNVRIDVLGGRGEIALENYYDRILVTCDSRLCDIVSEYNLSAKIAQKVIYTGYVSKEITLRTREVARAERGLKAGQAWVVCSAGGGKLGERLVDECEGLAREYPEVAFDIVHGPRSAKSWPPVSTSTFEDANIRYIRETTALPVLHAACDLVICPGGYNSLVEAMEGDARIICFPVQIRTSDEQYIHPLRLAKFRPISVVTDWHEMKAAFDREIPNISVPVRRARDVLDFNGIRRIRDIVLGDLFGSSDQPTTKDAG
jgi:predicted glycosyltransferase